MLSATELMNQAGDTASTYLARAVREIDTRFGEGYAEKNPQLVAAFMNAASTDFLATFLAQELSTQLGRIADAIEMKD